MRAIDMNIFARVAGRLKPFGTAETWQQATWIAALRDPASAQHARDMLFPDEQRPPCRRLAAAMLLATMMVSPALAGPPAGSAGDAAEPADGALLAKDAPTDERVAFHGQTTIVGQGNFKFRAPYGGANSFNGTGEIRETIDVTFYAGFRPWRGAELWINPEVDQGFGLRNTLGAAGFPSAEAYKVGKKSPYLRLPRLFLRQAIDLGGDSEAAAADLNQLAGSRATNRIVLTVGKFGVTDIFDNNKYAHDPRHDFLNWSVVDAGSMDYAADAWGYTYGGAAELYKGRYTLRVGLFDLSTVPNSVDLETGFRQFQGVAEIEERHTVHGHPGAIRFTGFASRGNMGLLNDAVAYAQTHGTPVDPVPVRRFNTSLGVSLNAEQEITDTVGVFARVGVGNGRFESFEFTDIDRTVTAGVAIKGAGFGRADDTIGVAGVINGATAARRRFLDAGGLGVLIGDGKLPHPGDEYIAEAYYDHAVYKSFHLTLDGQIIGNPGYNRDRGPVPLLAIRAHVQF